MRLGKITYTATEVKKSTFADTKLTKSFAEGDQHAILRLKRSKTDVNYIKITDYLSSDRVTNMPDNSLTKTIHTRPTPIKYPTFQALLHSILSPESSLYPQAMHCLSRHIRI